MIGINLESVRFIGGNYVKETQNNLKTIWAELLIISDGENIIQFIINCLRPHGCNIHINILLCLPKESIS